VNLLIGGMHRSGSTFSFNIAREQLSRTGPVIAAVAESFDESKSIADDAHYIIKSHTPTDMVTRGIREGRVKCICTIRKPEDAIASFMHAFGFDLEPMIGQALNWLSWYSSVCAEVFTIKYELIDESPVTAISLMDRYLTGATCDDRCRDLALKYAKSPLKAELDEMQEDSNTTNIGFSYYHNETLFHRRHISSVISRTASDVISDADIHRIRGALKEYVNEDGNLSIAGMWHTTDSHELRSN
jgi:Sulfotransferase domain